MFSRIVLFLPKIGISKLNIETLNGKKRVLLKMCKFPLTGRLQKICNFFFAKLVQFVSFCQRLSKKLNFIKIWQVKVGQNKDLVCYRKKQSFRQWTEDPNEEELKAQNKIKDSYHCNKHK